MRRRPLLLGLVFCSWYAFASQLGDVNGDGAVDVADLERARKIEAGALPYEAAADVDGDSAVTKIDTWLIKEAVLGRPIPELVGSVVIGPAGGTLSHGDITVSFSPGAGSESYVSLFRCPDEVFDDDTLLQKVYIVCGIATNQTGMGVAFSNSSDDTGLCAGNYYFPYDADEMSWHWHLFPGNSFDRNGTTISRAFPAPTESPLALTHSMKFATATVVAPPALSVAAGEKLLKKTATSSTVPGYQYSGFKYTGWIGDLFHVYTPNWGTVSYDDLRDVCGMLNDMIIKVNGQLGFPLSEISENLPLDIYVLRDLKNYGAFVNIPLLPYRIEVRSGLPKEELKATLGHELMHFVLNGYGRGDFFAFETMEDAITTWFEALAADNPAYLAGNYTRQPAHVLNSLFVPITRVTHSLRGFGSRDFGPQEERGYANSAFVDYHFTRNPDWIYELASKVKDGQNIKRALDSLFIEKQGVLYDLERQYLQFARDYMMYTTDCYSSKLLPELIFSGGVSPDLKGMYKLFQIKKASSNLWEKQTVDLTVQDYGCGIVQWTLLKPSRIFSPHTKLRVSGPSKCKALDLIVRYQDENKNWHSEIVTGTYDQNAEEDKKWNSAITLPKDTLNIMLFALATMGNGGSVSDYAETHDVTLTYQFEGDYYMPMQEMFARYTEISSQSTYYSQQIYSDAILRIVDPVGEVGLDHFTVDRTTAAHPQPANNYTVNMGFSSISASRRNPDAFQMRVFSDTRAPDLMPFTININPNGYYPATIQGQTPILAGDGSPKMTLMLYHFPISAIDQMVPGESNYRIQNITTSANNMRQSADGQNGGVLVSIPAQINAYRCLLYVDVVGAQTAFLVSIDPMHEGGE